MPVCPNRAVEGLMGTVISIGKLGAGQADYYLEQAQGRLTLAASVAGGVEDYYVGGYEAAGYWIGGGSERLGVRGEVDREALTRVLEGVAPDNGERLVPERARRVPGFDVTFSAPKSVSVLFGLGDEPLRRAIRGAHEGAVADGLAYLERVSARGRRGEDGRISIEGNGFVGAAFRHRTSRAGDPQLHTHVLVANIVEGVDGRWSALDGRGLYQQAKTAGYLYEAALRARLTAQLGVRWTSVRNGIADVEGVPMNVLRAFSRRRAEVEAELRRRGASSAAAARMATLSTRQRKDYGVVPEQLVGEWRERAARLGFDRAAWRRVVGRERGREERVPVDWERAFARLAAPTGLTRRLSTFARRDVIQALCELVPPEASLSVSELEAAADEFLSSRFAVPVMESERVDATPAIRRRDGRMVFSRLEARYSTVELLALEREVIETAIDGRSAGVGVARGPAVHQALAARSALAGEQVRMVQRLTLDGERVAIVIGQAGTGKTFALAAAREAWETSGAPVLGAAVARRAARELTDGAGIASTSVAALKARLRAGESLPLGVVLVVDEAGMLPTRDVAELLDHVVAATGKLVLVGDDRQLPELEAGGCFRGLSRRLPAIVLGDNRRQHALWERNALAALRNGEVDAALAEYASRGRVVMVTEADDARRQLVTDWWGSGGPRGGIMIALRRADVRALNALARDAMVAAGRVGGPELLCGGEPFAAGDVVVVRQNDARRAVANGDLGVVQAVHTASLDVDIRGRTVRLDGGFLTRQTVHGDPVLAHGYAVTGHVSQGLTADRAFVLGSDVMYREWAYTAMSRGRVLNRLYVVGDTEHARDEIAPRECATIQEELVGALRRSQAQVMALDAGERSEDRAGGGLYDLAQERARLERKLQELGQEPERRWWQRRRPPRGGGSRALIEGRLVELELEESRLSLVPEPHAPAERSHGPQREIARDVLER
jgi:conjugative relaxase-like TrwC/TraI family protein